MNPLTLENIKARSKSATCGAFEREVVIKTSNVSKAKRLLSKDFFIVGQGPGPSSGTKVVWYNPKGVNL